MLDLYHKISGDSKNWGTVATAGSPDFPWLNKSKQQIFLG
jgi:hypothetical protein